jgi:hypothetical protein
VTLAVVLELAHPMGGLFTEHSSLKFRGVVEAEEFNFIRLVRAAFIASHLDDFEKLNCRSS